MIASSLINRQCSWHHRRAASVVLVLHACCIFIAAAGDTTSLGGKAEEVQQKEQFLKAVLHLGAEPTTTSHQLAFSSNDNNIADTRIYKKVLSLAVERKRHDAGDDDRYVNKRLLQETTAAAAAAAAAAAVPVSGIDEQCSVLEKRLEDILGGTALDCECHDDDNDTLENTTSSSSNTTEQNVNDSSNSSSSSSIDSSFFTIHCSLDEEDSTVACGDDVGQEPCPEYALTAVMDSHRPNHPYNTSISFGKEGSVSIGMKYCESPDNTNNDDIVCGCSISVSGEPCLACDICSDDSTGYNNNSRGFRYDCSNIALDNPVTETRLASDIVQDDGQCQTYGGILELYALRNDTAVWEDQMTAENCDIFLDYLELGYGEQYDCQCTGVLMGDSDFTNGTIACQSTEDVCSGDVCAAEAAVFTMSSSPPATDADDNDNDNADDAGVEDTNDVFQMSVSSTLLFSTYAPEIPGDSMTVDIEFCPGSEEDLCSCAVTVFHGETATAAACSECEICEDRESFRFDCTNVQPASPVQHCTNDWLLGDYVETIEKSTWGDYNDNDNDNSNNATTATTTVDAAVNNDTTTTESGSTAQQQDQEKQQSVDGNMVIVITPVIAVVSLTLLAVAAVGMHVYCQRRQKRHEYIGTANDFVVGDEDELL